MKSLQYERKTQSTYWSEKKNAIFFDVEDKKSVKQFVM